MKNHNKKILKMTLVSLGLLLVAYVLYKWEFSRNLINVIFMSFVISYFLKPAYLKLIEIGIDKRLSAAIMIIVLLLIFVICFSIIIPMIVKDSNNILNTVEEIRAYFMNLISKVPILNQSNIVDLIMEKASVLGSVFIERFFNGVIEFGENAFLYCLIPILIYYFLADRDAMGNKILLIFPVNKRQLMKEVYSDIDKILSRYIMSQLLLCIIIGILTLIVLLSLGVKYAFILSIINGVFNIIPYFGPVFGAIPAVLSALLISPQKAIWTLILLVALQQAEGDIISPKIIGGTVSMHPLIILVLLIIGGELGGLLGMVIAVPIGVVIKVIYNDLNYYLF